MPYLCLAIQFDPAAALLEQLIEKGKKVHGERSEEVAMNMKNLSETYQAQVATSVSKREMMQKREGKERERKEEGEENREREKLVKALKLVEEAEEIFNENLAKRNRTKVGEEEKEERKSAIAKQQKLGDELDAKKSMEMAYSRGEIHLQLDQPKNALPLLKKTLPWYRRVLGREHPETFLCLKLIGECHAKLGQAKEEERVRRECARIHESIVGK